MPDEENDIRIRQAADNYHPAYDDTAWDKMEKLLDEHLPQERKSRKIFFLLPSLLLVCSLILFIFFNNWEKNSSKNLKSAVTKNISNNVTGTNTPDVKSSEESINTSLNRPATSEKNRVVSPITSPNSRNLQTGKTNQVTLSSKKNYRNRRPANYKENLSDKSEILLKQEFIAGRKIDKKTITDESNKSNTSVNESLNKNNSIAIENENKTAVSKTDSQTKTTNKTEIRNQAAVAMLTNTHSETIKKKATNPNGFKNSFGITFSTGPESSNVPSNKAGNLTIIYGAGLSYQISERFTLRTGFYMSKKIYSVDPYDYHFPDGSGGYYSDLQGIDANCNVGEIPLNLNYNFGKVKNHNWFVSTGLSSYLMKKESYEYYYKTTTGDTYSKNWTIKNKNKNIFSVLNLSGGYQYSFNKQLSIMAEPYINLPLNGVGAGKVKLNSGGILLTIVAKPFFKKSK